MATQASGDPTHAGQTSCAAAGGGTDIGGDAGGDAAAAFVSPFDVPPDMPPFDAAVPLTSPAPAPAAPLLAAAGSGGGPPRKRGGMLSAAMSASSGLGSHSGRLGDDAGSRLAGGAASPESSLFGMPSTSLVMADGSERTAVPVATGDHAGSLVGWTYGGAPTVGTPVAPPAGSPAAISASQQPTSSFIGPSSGAIHIARLPSGSVTLSAGERGGERGAMLPGSPTMTPSVGGGGWR
eukprot:365183-Chlamydomonas_euryale.AAC.1